MRLRTKEERLARFRKVWWQAVILIVGVLVARHQGYNGAASYGVVALIVLFPLDLIFVREKKPWD